jgi:dTMP kinase
MRGKSTMTKAPRGIFITFEGSEGCGKSTQIRRLRARLEAEGATVLVTREPGGTALGEKIRHLLQHDEDGDGMCPETELLLFTASRAQLVREVIEPALAAGTQVLADRFLDSTTVYQGIARPLAYDSVVGINRFAVGACLPDVTFLLDMDSEAGRARAKAREGLRDRMEEEPAEFYETVRRGYLRLAEEEPKRIRVLDADVAPEALAERIWTTLTDLFPHGLSR